MSDTKFTKGVWSMRNGYIGVIDQSDTQSYGMMLNICSMDTWDFNNWKSNAHLIAAAPEMYEMLDEIMRDVSQVNVIEIRKLLEKARGE